MNDRERVGARTAALALGVTLAIQIFVSLAATATSVLAPEIARDVGVGLVALEQVEQPHGSSKRLGSG